MYRTASEAIEGIKNDDELNRIYLDSKLSLADLKQIQSQSHIADVLDPYLLPMKDDATRSRITARFLSNAVTNQPDPLLDALSQDESQPLRHPMIYSKLLNDSNHDTVVQLFETKKLPEQVSTNDDVINKIVDRFSSREGFSGASHLVDFYRSLPDTKKRDPKIIDKFMETQISGFTLYQSLPNDLKGDEKLYEKFNTKYPTNPSQFSPDNDVESIYNRASESIRSNKNHLFKLLQDLQLEQSSQRGITVLIPQVLKDKLDLPPSKQDYAKQNGVPDDNDGLLANDGPDVYRECDLAKLRDVMKLDMTLKTKPTKVQELLRAGAEITANANISKTQSNRMKI